MRRLLALLSMVVLVVVAAARADAPGSALAIGDPDPDQARPPGLDDAWPACYRATVGQQGDSIGCLVGDKDVDHAHDVFLYGKVKLNDGRPIAWMGTLQLSGNVNGGIWEGGHETGTGMATLVNGYVGNGEGWWGAWIPVRLPDGTNPDGSQRYRNVDPVTAGIYPRFSYQEVYGGSHQRPPVPAPWGGESELVPVAGLGGAAYRMPDLVLPGPPHASGVCKQVQWTPAAGGRVHCQGSSSPTLEPDVTIVAWDWTIDVDTHSGDSFDLTFPDEGTHRYAYVATDNRGWKVDGFANFVVAECGAIPCLDSTVGEQDTDPAAGAVFAIPVTVTNAGDVELRDVQLQVAPPDGLEVVETPSQPTLASGASAQLLLRLRAATDGFFDFQVTPSATLPSGRTTSGDSRTGSVRVGGTDLRLTIQPPPAFVVGSTADLVVVARNVGVDPIEDVAQPFGELSRTGILDVGISALPPPRTLQPGEETEWRFPSRALADGSVRVTFRTSGTRNGEYLDAVDSLDVTVGGTGIVVNDPGDASDMDLGTSECDASPEEGQQCTLRAAIETANAQPGYDTITFDLGAAATITPLAPLPAITEGAGIDGAGAIRVAKVAGTRESTAAFVIAGGEGTAVSGLTVEGWGTAVHMAGGRDTRVSGNTFRSNVIGVLSNAPGGFIGANTFDANGTGGAGTGDPRDDARTEGCAILLSNGSGDTTVVDDVITNTALGVMAVADGALGRVTVTGGRIEHAAIAVLSANAPGGSVLGLEVSGVTIVSPGIGVVAASVHGPVTISDNGFEGAGVGVMAVDDFEGLAVLNNQFHGGVFAVLGAGNDRFDISRNTIASDVLWGLFLANDAPTSGVVSQNDVAAFIGVTAFGQDSLTLSDNVIHPAELSGTKGIGVLVSLASHLQLTGNQVRGGGGGVLLGAINDGAITGNTITGNTLAIAGIGRELTPEEQASLATSGTTGAELSGRAHAPDAAAGLDLLRRLGGPDIGPGTFWPRSALFSGVNVTGNMVTGNRLGVVLGGGPVAVQVNDNTIANNDVAGVILASEIGGAGPQAVEIRRNSMHGNGTTTPDGRFAKIPGIVLLQNSGLAYDYSTTKPHPNDALDADSGPNGMQNFPEIMLVTSAAAGSHVKGVLNSEPGKDYLVDLYANDVCHASNYGEGKTWLLALHVLTDGAGKGAFDADIPRLALNQPLTATASGPAGAGRATSEFSPCAFPALATSTGAAAPAGSTRVGVTSNDGFAIGDWVTLNPGGTNEETARIIGFGSFILDRPLRFDHAAGETIVLAPAPPVDTAAPDITCGASDSAWHAANVTIHCTATDAGSGLADTADAAFDLVTGVPAGAEDGNAATGSREVCDVLNNCATAGPIAGNHVDRKAPTIAVTAPVEGQHYTSPPTPAFTCDDTGSGIDSCTGATAATPGVPGGKTFTVTARDHAGNEATRSVSFVVASAPSITGTPPSPATAGVPYSFAFTVAGEPAPVVTLVPGMLPPGLSLSPSGVLSGTPALAGTFKFAVRAANGAGPDAIAGPFTIVVRARVTVTVTSAKVDTDRKGLKELSLEGTLRVDGGLPGCQPEVTIDFDDGLIVETVTLAKAERDGNAWKCKYKGDPRGSVKEFAIERGKFKLEMKPKDRGLMPTAPLSIAFTVAGGTGRVEFTPSR